MNLEDILLTDEEIIKAICSVHDYVLCNAGDEERAVAKAAQKKLVEWLDTMCYDQEHNAFAVRRGDCLKCQQALRREVASND